QLRHMLRQQGTLSSEDVKTVVEVVTQSGEPIGRVGDKTTELGGRFVRPRTDGQTRYVRAMREHDLTLCVCPAGTGKTWLDVSIVDEGQNATLPQMRMFVTLMAHGSGIVVAGDVAAVDLPRQARSGLVDVIHRLRNVERVAIVHLDVPNILRNPLVQHALRA